MKPQLFPVLSGAILAWGVPLSAAEVVRATDRLPVDASRGEFTLVLVPDTQRYARNNPAMFFSQTHWIRDTHEALNIRFVIHLGDIVDDNTDREWRVADQAMGVLDAHVPYMVVPGNHDYEVHPARAGRRRKAPAREQASRCASRCSPRLWRGRCSFRFACPATASSW